MKEMKIAVIIVLILVALGMSGYLITAVVNGKADMPGSHTVGFGVYSAELVNTQEIEVSGIHTLEILYDHTSLDIIFYENNADILLIKEYMYDKAEENELAVITRSDEDGRLTVQGGKIRSTVMFFGVMTGSQRIEVYLPKGYRGSVTAKASSGDIACDWDMRLGEKLLLKTSSGDIELGQISAQEIEIAASSGRIRIERADGKRTFSATSGDIQVRNGVGDSRFSTSSGSIKVYHMEGDFEVSASSGDVLLSNVTGSGRIQTSSGGIRCEDVRGDMERVSASSGDISIKGLTGGFDGNTNSGEIHVIADALTGDITAKTSSGDVRLELPRESEFWFSARTSSGDIRTWFDEYLRYNKKGNEAEGTVGEVSKYKVSTSTTSGSITIR